MELTILAPNPGVLALAVLMDLVIGDPQYAAHPIRLMGRSISFLEQRLRVLRLDGYGGGVLLCVLMVIVWSGGTIAMLAAVDRWNHGVALVLAVYVLYSMISLRSLLEHGWAIETAVRGNDLSRARYATSRFVGRDTEKLSFAECRRAAIESISENLTDGYISPLFWYAVAGLPGVVMFKVFSTLDSMVGNRSERYVRFGWCGARCDDVLNWVPARMTWILIVLTALFIPRCSASKAFSIGWRQHALVPSPNSGWSEAATAGAIQRRLVGPIWKRGALVTDLWLGDSRDPAAGDDRNDVGRAIALSLATGLLATGLCLAAIFLATQRSLF
jgi:adenosylcobinamide-phosphate synthase